MYTYTNHQDTMNEMESKKKKFLIIYTYIFFNLTMNRKINQNDDDALVCAMSIQITHSKQKKRREVMMVLAQIHWIAILEYDIQQTTSQEIL